MTRRFRRGLTSDVSREIALRPVFNERVIADQLEDTVWLACFN